MKQLTLAAVGFERYAMAMTWSAATHLFRGPRNACRLICMDAREQIQIAKNAWARWWEF
jgi:hypothetical protein